MIRPEKKINIRIRISQAGILTAGGYYNGRLSLFYKLGESYDDPSNEDKWETAVCT